MVFPVVASVFDFYEFWGEKSSLTLLFVFVIELSLYELHRTPQDSITDDTEISISPRSLHSELMCPICLDMLKNTMTTKEVRRP
jgi:hypothetical protein